MRRVKQDCWKLQTEPMFHMHDVSWVQTLENDHLLLVKYQYYSTARHSTAQHSTVMVTCRASQLVQDCTHPMQRCVWRTYLHGKGQPTSSHTCRQEVAAPVIETLVGHAAVQHCSQHKPLKHRMLLETHKAMSIRWLIEGHTPNKQLVTGWQQALVTFQCTC